MRTLNKKGLDMYLFLILLIPHVQPAFFGTIEWMESLYNLGRVTSGLIIILIYINHDKTTKLMLIVIMFQLALLIPTIYNNGNFISLLITSSSVIALCMLVEIYIKKNALAMLDGMNILFELLIYANFIIMLLFPKGIHTVDIDVYYLFGGTNVAIRMILPGVCVSLLRSYFRFGKITFRSFLVVITTAATVTITWSVTAMVGFSIVIIFSIFYRNRPFPAFFNYFSNWFVSVLFMVLVVIFRMQDLFATIITDIFDKSLTFTGRTRLWDNALYYIQKSPVWGWGVENKILVGQKVGNQNGSHDYYLDILYRGGFILLTLLVIIIVIVGKKILKNQSNRFSQIITIIITSYFIMWIFEPFYNQEALMFAVFFMGYHVDSIIKHHKNYREVRDVRMLKCN
ncbi:O-antigen ligase family protein [Bacillus sp. es.034]|uniref:O-antigen ligase family protein n=1 Tax=Bacillus sp. es.034 TaxID=1761763 RepID=UPI000C00F2A4|nr:O-antigen ligase family protein [Bacillus sp. es.034]PFG04479.1 O-antigen ligase [Bacillus sp. es.034]